MKDRIGLISRILSLLGVIELPRKGLIVLKAVRVSTRIITHLFSITAFIANLNL